MMDNYNSIKQGDGILIITGALFFVLKERTSLTLN
jgi:hypothetical protein